MKTKVTITCDRCGKIVRGVIIENKNLPTFTGGFFDLSNGNGWNEFSKTPSEKNICDNCMWSDPAYLIKYHEKQKFPE